MSLPSCKHPYTSNEIELSSTIYSSSDQNGAGDHSQTRPAKFDFSNRSTYARLKACRTNLTGWRFGATKFSALAFVVFLINLIVTIRGLISHPTNRSVLFEGDCKLVKNYNTGFHVLINIMSTVLISGSNYCMQCLSAPNRSEVDSAHAKGKWLDIGIPSLHNLKSINIKRKVLWVLLGLSSIPLHLLYNSAVFGSITSYSYNAFSVSESFIQSPECLNCANHPPPLISEDPHYSILNHWKHPYSAPVLLYDQYGGWQDVLATLWQDAHDNKLDKIDAAECLEQYATTIQSNRRNLLLVAKDTNFPPPEENYFINGSMAYWAGTFLAASIGDTLDTAANSYSWICSGLKNNTQSCADAVGQIKSAPETWRVGYYCDVNDECTSSRWPVDYCLSQKAQPRCKLQFIPMVLIIVTALNFVKAGLMLCTVFFTREDPLITMGDAVASFLEKEDPTTRNMCLSSVKDFKKQGYQVGARVWNNDDFKWRDATKKRSRVGTLTLFLITIVGVTALLILGIVSLPKGQLRSLAALARLGYGAVDGRLMLTSFGGITATSSAIIANTPQLILSLLYFFYNALFTAMLAGVEWASYAHKRKGLRVSRAFSGEQRSTYFLQLPYRFGVPLVILSGTLHWLVSQSIFLVAIDFYNFKGEFGNSGGDRFGWPNVKTCGFSPIAIFSAIILAILMLVAIIGFGYIPYKRGMTLVGSCSMAISAACHPIDHVDGSVAAVQMLQWGVVGTNDDVVGHCTFSPEEVEQPIIGQMYAGEL